MALNASGPISLGGSTTGQSIAVELGLSPTAAISLNQTNVRTLAGVPSGAIVMPTNFYGKSNAYVFNATISANTYNYNLRAAAVAAGWNQTTALQATVTINSGVYVGSTTTGGVAFTWTGSYPSGSTLSIINNGTIEGAGGAGGDATQNGAGGSGSAGGPALQGNYAVSITNNNIVGGGGGGGGAGGAYYFAKTNFGGGGGGGGGAGYALSAGGLGNCYASRCGSNGSAGTLTAGGAYGPSYDGANGNGGNGGGRGAAGSAGGSGTTGAGSGGAGGNCTVSGTNAYITWVATGTRLGTLG